MEKESIFAVHLIYNKIMKKSLFLFLLAPICMLAQQFSGVATYQSSTKFDLKMDTTKVPPDRIKMINEMMRKELFKEYTLKFNKQESIFEEVEALEENSSGRMGMMAMMLGGGGGIVYKNVQEKSQLEQTEFFGKMFLITDSLKLENWKLGKENKQIGSYTCYKATTTRTILSRKLSREEENSVDTTEIEITAWYTPQIPLSQGPDIYWGLPGLILEVSTDKTTFLCTKIELNMKENLEIKAPKNGDKVTRDEYNEIMEAKLKEMEQMGRGQGKGRGPGGRGSMEIRISR